MKLLMIQADDGSQSVLTAKDENELKAKYPNELQDTADGNCQIIKCEGAGEDQKFYNAEVEVINADPEDEDGEDEVNITWGLIA